MKRPPPPMVQTSVHGAKSSQSSPSPSLSSKRPPPSFKHPPSTASANGTNGATTGTGARTSNRRRDSQRPGDNTSRPPRSARLGPGENTHGDRKPSKRVSDPYGNMSPLLSRQLQQNQELNVSIIVKTTSYMLKKYRKAVPSLVLQLHPTHFRFDMQDGSFSYNSPLKVLLEHIKAQTIPHDMLDELKHAGVKFYESVYSFSSMYSLMLTL